MDALKTAYRENLVARLRRVINELAVDEETQVCLYRSLKDEADPSVDPVNRFFYPRVEGDQLRFFKPRSAKDFSKGRFGIEEPLPERSQAFDPRKPALVFCPALAVDRHGTRLGLGKGYYDRFFTQHPQVLRLAVVLQAQISKTALPKDTWDQAVDWIVSEQMILKVHLKGVRSHGSQFAS